LQVSIADSYSIIGATASLSASDAAEAIPIDGSAGDDVLNGTEGDDAKVRGLNGIDTVDGGLGNDFVNGMPDLILFQVAMVMTVCSEAKIITPLMVVQATIP
jgi:hypothetical protein